MLGPVSRPKGACFTGSRGLVAAALVALVALHAPLAHAELSDDATRVTRLWSAAGASVSRASPLFLQHGRPRLVATAPAAATEAGCTRLLFLAERTVSFAVALTDELPAADAEDSGRSSPEGDDSRVTSVGGVVELERCGAARSELESVVVMMVSPRGTLEQLVATSDTALGPLAPIFPERESGPVAPRSDPGHGGALAPVAERLALARRGALDDGATRAVDVTMTASARGTGEFSLRMGEGCHRLTLLADPPSFALRFPVDLDAEVRDAEDSSLLARDRGEAAEARADFCLGEPTLVSVRFGGAPGPAEVTLVDAVWPLPDALPMGWGARARAGMAAALRRRGAPPSREAPLLETLGAHGTTFVPFEVTPGACYVATLALLRGETRGLRLSAEVGERRPQEQVGADGQGAAIAFCATSETRARLVVEVRSTSAFWVLSVARSGALP